MRASIETGVGLTAAKLMVGKAVANSDGTYIAKAQLREAFKKLSKFLNVTGVEPPSQPKLAKTVVNQQREITDLKDTIKDLTGRLDIITKDFSQSASSQELAIQDLQRENEAMRERLNEACTLLNEIEALQRKFEGLKQIEEENQELREQLGQVMSYIEKFGPIWEKQFRELGRKVGNEMQQLARG